VQRGRAPAAACSGQPAGGRQAHDADNEHDDAGQGGTTFDLDEYVYGALAAGASGFLLKHVSPEYLTAAIRMVRSGDALLAPSVTRRLVERFALQTSAPALTRRDLSHLTPRELDVLRLLARGLSNAEIAAQLTLSDATVKTHVARLLAKLQLRDRIQAVILAYETGLVNPGHV
jgi:DNA-binding NarL/FixJ family response regulator